MLCTGSAGDSAAGLRESATSRSAHAREPQQLALGGSIVKTLLKISLVLAIGLSASAVMAFHDGGVAECAGCHTMHNSQDGVPVDGANPGGNEFLLTAATPSDACLRCHAGYGQFRDGTGYGPGGDFYWVTKDFSWLGHSPTPVVSSGDSHGHNVISTTAGIVQDATLTAAPGGTFDSQYLRCTSCHDPHGNQNFRLLYGTAEGPRHNGSRYSFTAEAPVAIGNSRKTYTSDGEERSDHHTVYISGMSEWCANCHIDMHSGNNTNFIHPTGENLGSTIAANYNAYVSTDDLTGGSAATSYLGLVPFEDVQYDPTTDPSTILPAYFTAGPDGQDQVMCLTCHRSHASAFGDIARWDMSETFLIDSHPNAGDIAPLQADIDNAYYNYDVVQGTVLTQNQRSLCNKCHVKDLGDAPY